MAENFLEYKKRIIDSKSASFCGAKWYNATIWLGTGMTTSCHHPPAHSINVDEVVKNPKALHNTDHKKEMRKLMQAGEKPSECEYCWKIESIHKNNVSDRVFKTQIYTDQELKEAFESNYQDDINLKTLEVAFDNTCNFACSYCNANFSTKWAHDILKNGSYTNLQSDGAGHFVASTDSNEVIIAKDDNPYVQAFWRWWPELSITLKEIRITGGEPLLNKNIWKFFDFFESNKQSDLVFAVNSNLGADQFLIDKFIEKSHSVKNLKLFTSCEAYGIQAEYIRDGLNYKNWLLNLNRVLREGRIQSCNIMMTIGALCLFSIVHFLDDIMKIKSLYPEAYLKISVNILRFPSFQSVLTLPYEIRLKKSEEINDWILLNHSSSYLTMQEIEGLKRLVEYLKTEDTQPHAQTSDLATRRADFKSFYTQYDSRRGKSFEKTFPDDLVSWYKGI